jgi:hypothetical protein
MAPDSPPLIEIRQGYPPKGFQQVCVCLADANGHPLAVSVNLATKLPIDSELCCA